MKLVGLGTACLIDLMSGHSPAMVTKPSSVGIGADWGKPYYNALTWTRSMVSEGAKGFDLVAWRPQDRFDPNMQVLDIETRDKWPNLTAALLRRGIPESTVVKIVGGNFLRVFREVCG